MEGLKKMWRPAGLAALLSLIIAAYVLLVPPIIGLADRGEQEPVFNKCGLYLPPANLEHQGSTGSENGRYKVSAYFNEETGKVNAALYLYVTAAKGLSMLLTGEAEWFDIRFLSCLLIGHLAVGIYALTEYISFLKTKREGVILALLAVFVFTDTGYTARFPSFYPEGVVTVCLLTGAACVFLLVQRREKRYWLIAGILLNGLLLLLAIEPFGEAERYYAMTGGVLSASEDDKEALREFGIREQFAILEGAAYEEVPPLAGEGERWFFEDFKDRYGYPALAAYYLVHPGRFLAVVQQALSQGQVIPPAGTYEYEKESGEFTFRQTDHVTGFSRIKEQMAPKTAGFFCIWLLFALAVCLRSRREFYGMIFFVLLCMVSAGAAVFGAGSSGAGRYLFFTYTLFDLISFVAFAPYIAGAAEVLICGIMKKKKKSIKQISVLLLVLLVTSLWGSKAEAAEIDETDQQSVLIVTDSGQEAEFFKSIAEASGKSAVTVSADCYKEELLLESDYLITASVHPLSRAASLRIPTLVLGEACGESGLADIRKYRNVSLNISYLNWQQGQLFYEELEAFSGFEGKAFGLLEIGERAQAPVFVEKDGVVLMPAYQTEGVWGVLLGEAAAVCFGATEEEAVFFVLEKLYPYSRMEEVCRIAEQLYAEGIPFLAEVMPVRQPADQAAGTDYLRVLGYLRSLGGTIVPQGSFEAVRLPLTDVGAYGMSDTWENLRYKTAVTVQTDAMSADECVKLIKEIGKSNTAFGEWMKDSDDIWQEYIEIVEKPIFSEEERPLYASFFETGNHILLVLVGIGIAVLVVILLFGRKWYYRKFFRQGE